MTISSTRVYVSSTYEDLKAYRSAVIEALRRMNLQIVSMEDYGADGQRPLEKCLEDVAGCDIYVGIFAWKYGYIPLESNSDGKSITELEYRHALKCGKKCLIFLIDPNQPWSPAYMEHGEAGEKLAAFRRELETRHMRALFRDPSDLVSQVQAAVHNALAQAPKDTSSGVDAHAADTLDKFARRVFVAKPSRDMKKRYDTLLEELRRRDFVVVPDPQVEFDTGVTVAEVEKTLDAALADVEISIHLIGSESHFKPAGSAKDLIELQADRAAARRSAKAVNSAGVPFQRIFWAPKDLIVDDELVAKDRDPQTVCSAIAAHIEGDSIVGETFTKLVQFVVDRLTAVTPVRAAETLSDGAHVYLQFQETDEPYAASVGAALLDRNLNVSWQLRTGAEARLEHQRLLEQCDAVVVCWADGADGRAFSAFEELRDLRKRRERDYAFRSLVVGPPKDVPGKTIALRLAEKKKDDIDIVLDLTEFAEPPPEAFDPLVKGTAHRLNREADAGNHR